MSSKLNKNLKVGRRTGVVIASPGKVPLDEDGMEKFDAFWDSEQPNEQNKKNDDHNNDNEGGEKMDDHDAEDGMKRSNNTNKTTAKFNVTNVTEIQQDEKSKAMYTKLTKRVIDRNKKLKEKGVLLSPSTTSVATEATEGTELTGVTDVSVQSPVLTNVTPAPERSDDHEEEEEERSENDQEDVHNDDVATSPASAVAAAASMSPITPGDVSIGSLSIEKGFLGRKKKLETLIEDEEKYSNENESENDMELGADVAVDEDGIGNERDISGDERESSTTNNCDNVDFGNDDDENMDDVNYSDNDEVSVIDEEETPMKVRRERAKKERKRLEAKKRAKRKKKKRASSSGSVVSFSSPMSVYLPAGPREYNNILVSDLKDSDDEEAEDKGVRRSRRTRFAPLKFWKNERVVYGPNDLPTTFGDMPVAATVQQALPTPMKKMHRQKPGKKSKRTKSDDSDEEAHISAAKLKIKKFDKKKLKKEYSYKNDKEEIANVWDEGIREFSNRRKCCWIFIQQRRYYLHLFIQKSLHVLQCWSWWIYRFRKREVNLSQKSVERQFKPSMSLKQLRIYQVGSPEI